MEHATLTAGTHIFTIVASLDFASVKQACFQPMYHCLNSAILTQRINNTQNQHILSASLVTTQLISVHVRWGKRVN